MNLDSSIKNIMAIPKYFAIQEKPIFSLYIYENSPFILVKDENKNTVKLALASEIIEYIEYLSLINQENSPLTNKRIEFLEEGTRLKTPNLTIIERKPEKFKIKYLKQEKNKQELIKKDFIAPNRIWIKTKNKVLLFFIEKWEEENTLLYKSILPNTLKNGEICWGINSKLILNNKTASELDKLYFEETIFTQDNNRIVYKDNEFEYSSVTFLEKFNCIPTFKNIIENPIPLKNLLNQN